jgi:hypothetical protein
MRGVSVQRIWAFNFIWGGSFQSPLLSASSLEHFTFPQRFKHILSPSPHQKLGDFPKQAR